jgi:hypothetical protein
VRRRFDADGGGDFARTLRGVFQRAAFGHVEDDLEFALVVERQHLDLHPADSHQRHGAEEQADDARKKKITPFPFRNHRPHDTAINAGKKVFFVLKARMMFAVRDYAGGSLSETGILFPPALDANRGPRRHDEGNRQREEHRRT